MLDLYGKLSISVTNHTKISNELREEANCGTMMVSSSMKCQMISSSKPSYICIVFNSILTIMIYKLILDLDGQLSISFAQTNHTKHSNELREEANCGIVSSSMKCHMIFSTKPLVSHPKSSDASCCGKYLIDEGTLNGFARCNPLSQIDTER